MAWTEDGGVSVKVMIFTGGVELDKTVAERAMMFSPLGNNKVTGSCLMMEDHVWPSKAARPSAVPAYVLPLWIVMARMSLQGRPSEEA
jgi:hypothetical protein